MKMLHHLKSLSATVSLAGLLALSPAYAADLIIGSSTEPSALDPHFSRTGNNQNIAAQIFDRLITPDPNLQVTPALAESWQNVDPTTWRIKLRSGVTFQDGSPLTAEDVIFSLNRVKDIPNSPAPFTGNIGSIANMTIVDPQTIEFKTKNPTPDFIEQVGLVYIVQKKLAEGKTIEAFNDRSAAIGTGPYKVKEWVPGDHVTLVRNDAYWGKKPAFENVTIKFIANDAARVAALRSGSVDLIDAVPPGDVKTLSGVGGVKLWSIPSARVVYLALDASRDESPFVVGADGKPLNPNPLKDVRVRQALSKLVNRQLIVDRILDDAGEAAGQIVPDGIGGADPSLKAPAADPEGAKKLLADAGYPQGFGLTLHTSNDRFPGDAESAQAIGQMFARGGIKVNGVVAQPYNVYASAAGKQQFSAFIFSLGTTTPTSATSLRNLLMTPDRDAGTGSFNRTRYSNAQFDEKMKVATSEFDPQKRISLLQEATRVAMNDVGVIPLFWPKVYWASKANVTYTANRGEDLMATLAGTAQ
ncbi:ABC transporter substrate-binding protein [Microvirga tunisiensis]|uniref:ABC transporter substrate-binding protein n=1 Tax=Microvirga tunisiensis TaxID=2108360 RepID=A0A5N7MQ16_9HYPH|nr:ABC transporter substrate-binding protein [Microvirga tunisiensis]MPR10543.1 ABC transporter substrate-binding protein [Microvirga tunisiensis]MPR28549.1 ABC transporter substrate-binding protein [Microvirga tunisiensis]